MLHDGFVTLSYRAKGGKERTVVIEDEHLSDVLRSLTETGSNHLFSFTDAEGEQRMVGARDVNAVIAAVAGPCFSAKDFRTWGGSRFALEARVEGAEPLEAIDAAAEALGNTRAVARSAYVHPTVLEAPEADVIDAWRRSRASTTRSRGDSALAKLLDANA